MDRFASLKCVRAAFLLCSWASPLCCMEAPLASLKLPLLHQAVTKGKINNVRFLLSFKADQDVRDANGRTPLFRAITKNNIEIVNLLLNHQADPNAADNSLQTPLHEASKWGNKAMVALLLERGANLGCCDAHQLTPAHVAIVFRQTELLRYLLERKAPVVVAKDGSTLMHFAAISCGVDTIALLCEQGHSVMAIDNSSVTPLHIVISKKGNKDVVFYLLDQGADPYALDAEHTMPVDIDAERYLDSYDAERKQLLMDL